MKIKSLHIKNFKSIVDLTINEPNPFTVFVGPNGSGKSNIFEALEYINLIVNNINPFVGSVKNFNLENEKMFFKIDFKMRGGITISEESKNKLKWEISNGLRMYYDSNNSESDNEIVSMMKGLSHIFVGLRKSNKVNLNEDLKLNTNTNNLEKVLKRLLENTEKREEISEWLDLFLPEFDRIEVQKSEFSSNENLLIYQKHYDRPFNKEFISDGTFNIIALLTAVYQSDEPQFLCIEEPENGLHPKVIKQLVNFFRSACEEKGHYIWLNTHSQTLVSILEPKEIILVDKKNGETQIKQFDKDLNLHGFEMDEAWLSNALGGGLPW